MLCAHVHVTVFLKSLHLLILVIIREPSPTPSSSSESSDQLKLLGQECRTGEKVGDVCAVQKYTYCTI